MCVSAHRALRGTNAQPGHVPVQSLGTVNGTRIGSRSLLRSIQHDAPLGLSSARLGSLAGAGFR
jgi:hypothetical protein